MKAILLAGGQGTRLRPLTLNTPKPVVPIFGRPFLHYQIDRILQVPEIDEIILSLNYQPERIEAVFGDGSSLGIAHPLRGRAGTARHRRGHQVRQPRHRRHDRRVQRRRADADRSGGGDRACTASGSATATIVLTPVENPAAYGLVETDAARQRPAVRREAGPGADHDQPHQRRHLRARAVHVRPHPRRRAVVDRAEVLPVAGRARRDLRRLRLRRLLDRHRHARQVHAGAPRHPGGPVPRRAVRDAVGVPDGRCADDARRGLGRHHRGPVLHRRRRRRSRTGARVGPRVGDRPRLPRRGRARWWRTPSCGPTAWSAPAPRLRGTVLGAACRIGRSASRRRRRRAGRPHQP